MLSKGFDDRFANYKKFIKSVGLRKLNEEVAK